MNNIDLEKEAFLAALKTIGTGAIKKVMSSKAGQSNLVQKTIKPAVQNQATKANQWGTAIANDWKGTQGSKTMARASSAYKTGLKTNPGMTAGATLLTGGAISGTANMLIPNKKQTPQLVQPPPLATGPIINQASIDEIINGIEVVAADIEENKKYINPVGAGLATGAAIGAGVVGRKLYVNNKAFQQQMTNKTVGLREFGDSMSAMGKKYDVEEAAFKNNFLQNYPPKERKHYYKLFSDIEGTAENTARKIPRTQKRDVKQEVLDKLDKIEGLSSAEREYLKKRVDRKF